ncbi:MAG: aldehyde dehydrogenase family protein, partial [Oscillospiraceae bacterium]
MTVLETQGLAAKNASRILSVAGTDRKNKALEAICKALLERQEELLAANGADLAAAREGGMIPSLIDRLSLDAKRIEGIVEGVRQVAALPDPIGQVTKMERRPNGLIIGRRRVPLGVVGIIYEARPNVTVDAAALCLKSGNAVILRGGKEAIHSNKAAVHIMRDALESVGLPRDCVTLVEDTS